jgi:hypothetical protein
MARTQARCQEAKKWIESNYGRGVMAPMTGTDWKAFAALVHAWDLWVYTREDAAEKICVALLERMQSTTREIGVWIIPFVADWSDEDRFRDKYYDRLGIAERPHLSPKGRQ